MARYQVSLIARPQDWRPQGPDDVPPHPDKPVEAIAETDDLFSAVRQAIEFNEGPRGRTGLRWAVVVQARSLGQTWPGTRLCTPMCYKVTAVWWPAGWEPASPTDVPNCVLRTQDSLGAERLTYPDALTRVRALNQQALDRAAPVWYVVIAVENEPVSKTISADSLGTETTILTRPIHVVRPEEAGKGSCAHCPAKSLDCAQEDWLTLSQETVTTTTRPVVS